MPERMRSDTNENVWSRSVPDPGQLVEIRRRQWVVSDVEASAFSSTGNGKQHLVSLGSLDEDSLGESLQVLWELEPGARVLERAGLPKVTGWDPTARLEAFLDAVRPANRKWRGICPISDTLNYFWPGPRFSLTK